MRQQYVPTQATRQQYRSALNSDLGVYRVQSGAGIGGFLKKLIKYVVPIGKSVLSKGFEMAKPELKKLASKGIEAAGSYATKQVQSAVNKAHTRAGTKRRNQAQETNTRTKRRAGIKRRKLKDTLS